MGQIYENLFRPVFFRMDPEQAHDRACAGLAALSSIGPACGLLRRFTRVKHALPVRLFGLEFPNRVGLAAGMDKDGEFARAIEALGFGHTEVGTVTPQEQPGNPEPRLFRFPEKQALVNRMGFNNKGAEAMAKRLAKTYPKGKRGMPVGVNIGKAKPTPLEEAIGDYLACFRMLADQADYFTVNISSPNTPGLRQLHGSEYLDELLGTLRRENCRHAKKMGHAPHPMLLKIAPDLSFPEIDSILEAIQRASFDGVIATNTTVSRPYGFPSEESGGLSGRPLRQTATRIIKYISLATAGKLPIIGVGGIDSIEAAGEKLDAGASLVQIYTGWVYRGPFFAAQVARALRARDTEWV